ncbi:Dephospho-CoA kinase [Thioalkalivibrio nitratireducens DSM 14787]|uniref:Dephospho-CoA kinase n=1 Tax=Thioalkalivibrio nitratireducens (strain DSM 14787 / UNIQEM 213 / ALEN2) TaxID=1255043 RepID=L0DZ01_THIND|nr:dephospho-CoA kinase [Thioalkalivibrio nitratireducens]AGA34232.1 Dephospho-CoA kinase [Thioalkalivibrio nitratireducens DSM 14787]
MTVLRVGLTGGIGSGKTRVAALFEALGTPVIDTDRLSRETLAPGQPLLERIFREFGSGLRRADGGLDRAALRQRIFADPTLRARLEAITHPAIGEAMEQRIAALPESAAYVVLVIPLLLEAGWQDRVDRILVVDCPEEVQVQRVMGRDRVDADAAWTMVRSQAARQARLRAADDRIDNSRPDRLAALERRVRELDRIYRAAARRVAGATR